MGAFGADAARVDSVSPEAGLALLILFDAGAVALAGGLPRFHDLAVTIGVLADHVAIVARVFPTRIALALLTLAVGILILTGLALARIALLLLELGWIALRVLLVLLLLGLARIFGVLVGRLVGHVAILSMRAARLGSA